jgi:hypothetical protein
MRELAGTMSERDVAEEPTPATPVAFDRHDAVDRLDELITRLERAAEQLRSGELSADAAATMVEDCAALAGEAGAELERLARAEAPAAPPGQDTLL